MSRDVHFREAIRHKLCDSVEALQADLEEWLEYYNCERPHPDYRNMGRRPIERIEEYLRMCGKKIESAPRQRKSQVRHGSCGYCLVQRPRPGY